MAPRFLKSFHMFLQALLQLINSNKKKKGLLSKKKTKIQLKKKANAPLKKKNKKNKIGSRAN